MPRSLVVSLLYGLLTSVIILLFSSLLIALLLRYTNIAVTLYTYITFIIGLIALFCGGVIAGVKRKANALLLGIGTGFLFSCLVFLIQFLGYNMLFTMQQTLYHVAYLIAAIVGSIFGVHIAKATS